MAAPDACADPRLRAAVAADAGQIAAIWAPVIRNTTITFRLRPHSPEDVAALIAGREADGHALLVAEAAGRILGFAGYSQFRPNPGYARTMEHTVLLAPEARGAGLGRALMAAVVDHATTAGHRGLIGAITAENAASLAFHRRLGFAEVGRIPEAGWKFDRFHDLVLIHLRLGDDTGRTTG